VPSEENEFTAQESVTSKPQSTEDKFILMFDVNDGLFFDCFVGKA